MDENGCRGWIDYGKDAGDGGSGEEGREVKEEEGWADYVDAKGH